MPNQVNPFAVSVLAIALFFAWEVVGKWLADKTPEPDRPPGKNSRERLQRSRR